MAEDDLEILIVYNEEDGVEKGAEQDLIALQDTCNTTQSLFVTLVSLGYRTSKLAIRDSLPEFERGLEQHSNQTTFIFNNCDGFNGNNMAAIQVSQTIEALGFKHTGSTAAVIERCINKAKTKDLLQRAGVPTPAYQVMNHLNGNFRVGFPAIVKPVAEDASIGIDLASVVETRAQLRERIAYVVETYRQPAIVEAFISGPELGAAVIGNETPEVLPLSEKDFSSIPNPLQRLLTYDSKWVPDSYMYHHTPVVCPTQIEPALEAKISALTVAAYHAIGLRDFARMDFRVQEGGPDGVGLPYVIDVNEIPDLAPGSGFAMAAQAAGYTYEAMVEKIIDLALRREGWR
jgi:D-alanine-D-alanine ligase